ncbi:MAG: hypothetical protein IPK97_17565 [Ahniella sp.]|nr:hypothetical protein [Ahniella sp.]
MPIAKRHDAVPGATRFRSSWAGLVLVVSRLLVGRAGADLFAGVLAGILLAAIFLIVSFRHLTIPFYMFILAVGGFRYIWSIQMPGLPDLYLDRMALIWLAVVFLIKYVSEQRKPLGALARRYSAAVAWPISLGAGCAG